MYVIVLIYLNKLKKLIAKFKMIEYIINVEISRYPIQLEKNSLHLKKNIFYE